MSRVVIFAAVEITCPEIRIHCKKKSNRTVLRVSNNAASRNVFLRGSVVVNPLGLGAGGVDNPRET